MEMKRYIEEKANYIYTTRLLKFIVLVLALLLAVNSILTYSMLSSQKIILVPPALDTKVYVSGSDASDEYLKFMARYICTLVLNYNPTVARAQFNDFLKLVSPSAFPAYKNSFYSLADKIETGGVSSAFYITQIQLDKKEGKMIVGGMLSQWTQDKQFITNETKKYLIKYRISDGLFSVYELKELVPGEEK